MAVIGALGQCSPSARPGEEVDERSDSEQIKGISSEQIQRPQADNYGHNPHLSRTHVPLLSQRPIFMIPYSWQAIKSRQANSTKGWDMETGSKYKWDKRYREQQFDPNLEPLSFLKKKLDPSIEGRALCLAAGNGRNAVYLAEKGFQVDAIDISEEGLRLCIRLAEARGVNINLIQADLLDYELKQDRYDLVTKFFYYQPALFEPIARSMRPGGLFMFQTFSRDQLESSTGPRNPDHLPQGDDILSGFFGLRLRFYEDLVLEEEGKNCGNRKAVIRFIAENQCLE